MNKKLKKIFTVLFIGLFIFSSTIQPTTLTVQAADNEYWDELSQLLEAASELELVINKFGITLDDLYALPQKEESFFDLDFNEIISDIDVAEDYSVGNSEIQTFAGESNDYIDLYIKQLKVISKAVNENRSRGMSKLNYTAEQDAVCMFIAHYIDGNGGTDMYYSEYGYQGQNMADWLTDEDRKAYKNLMDSLDFNDTAKSAAKWIDIGSTVYGSVQIANNLAVAKNGTKALEAAISLAGSTAAGAIPNPESFSYKDAIGIAAETLQYADVISEFQTQYFTQLATAYDYLDNAALDSLVACISAMIFASNPIAGVGVALASASIKTAGDSYVKLNSISLALSRNFRISERVMDYMEYNGYW